MPARRVGDSISSSGSHSSMLSILKMASAASLFSWLCSPSWPVGVGGGAVHSGVVDVATSAWGEVESWASEEGSRGAGSHCSIRLLLRRSSAWSRR